MSNPNEYIRISTGIADNMSNGIGTCAVETAQTIAQCNEHAATVLIIGLVIGCIAGAIGMYAGMWYHGRHH